MIKYHTQDNKSFLYILVNDRFLKIGKADNLYRVSEMLYRYEFNYYQSYLIEIDTSKSSVFKLEKLLHNQYQNYKWYPPVKMDGSSELFSRCVLEMIQETFDMTTKYIDGIGALTRLNLVSDELIPISKNIRRISYYDDYSKEVEWMF